MSAPSPWRPQTPPEFSQWLAAAREGSKDALGRLLEACGPLLLQLADRELAPGLRANDRASTWVQQSLREAQQAFGNFSGTTAEELLAWLRRILLNNVAHFSGQDPGMEQREASRELPAGRGRPAEVVSPSAVAMAHEQAEACARALQHLPEEYEEVIRLRHQQNCSFPEISRRMACARHAARWLWARAVEHLQQALGGPLEASHPAVLEEPFARLLEIADEALVAGRTPEPLDDPAVPAALRSRLRTAWACLKLLEAVWPREPLAPRATRIEEAEADTTDFEAALLPERIGCFRILEELGRGGMGVVYKAWQAGLNRVVVLKVIRSGDFASPEELSRFRREAEAVARLQHPNIVQIHDIGEVQGQPYFCLEYVAGGNLAQYLGGQRLPARRAAEFVEQLARAMDRVHQQGIVHRDLKPSNILLHPLTPPTRRPGEELPAPGARPEAQAAFPAAPCLSGSIADYLPKITDFGLAKLLDADQMRTQTGAVLGTPCYMAPEQAHGQVHAVGPATDVYALGAILYELLTGRPPFQGKSLGETLDQVRRQEPVPPRCLQASVPQDLETICLQCLEKEPGKRYASADALAEDLRRWRHHERIRGRPPQWFERMRRFLRRYLVLCGSAAVILSVAVLLQ